jgi:hypothetical protein
MKKTFLTEVTILSIYDFQNDHEMFLGNVLSGICVIDETKRFKRDFRIITSLIQKQNNLEFITKKGSCYIADTEPRQLDIKLSEFVVMLHFLLSPDDILVARNKLKHEFKTKLH